MYDIIARSTLAAVCTTAIFMPIAPKSILENKGGGGDDSFYGSFQVIEGGFYFNS